jgi:hypothetical protein
MIVSSHDRNTLIEKIVREEEVIKPFRLPYPVEAPLVEQFCEKEDVKVAVSP